MFRFKSALPGAFMCIAAAIFSTGSGALAAPFSPVIDEFWIEKNGAEIFRDSFSGGGLPPNGPDGASTYSGGATAGLGGFVSETGGKLTMTPALGSPTLITGLFADTFTGGLRLRSTNPMSGDFLGVNDSFQIHGLFDMSSLPSVTGQSFGIRATDVAGPGTGDDVAQLTVAKSNVSGDIGVRFAELDFIGNTSQTADFISIQSVLATAAQIELVVTKAAGTNLVAASFTVFDAGMQVLQSSALDTINNTTMNPITIYNGELFTRAQFHSTDTGIPLSTVPEPGTLAMFGLGLVGLGFIRRRRAG